MKDCCMIDICLWPKSKELAGREGTCSSRESSGFLTLASGGFVHDGMLQSSARNLWNIFRMMSFSFRWVCLCTLKDLRAYVYICFR